MGTRGTTILLLKWRAEDGPGRGAWGWMDLGTAVVRASVAGCESVEAGDPTSADTTPDWAVRFGGDRDRVCLLSGRWLAGKQLILFSFFLFLLLSVRSEEAVHS